MQVDGDEDLRLAVSPDKAVELQLGEIAVEISVDDLSMMSVPTIIMSPYSIL